MALSGKKITELEQVSSVTVESVLPIVKIQETEVADTATKVSVNQLQNKFLEKAQAKKVIVTSSETEAVIELATANTIYKFEEPLISLEIDDAEISYEETLVYFTTSSNGFSLSLGITLLGNDVAKVLETNKSYILHIKDGLASIEGLSDTPCIRPITATSGQISLAESVAFSMTVDGPTEFILPDVSNNSWNLSQILLQLKIEANTTIDWGTTNYFRDEPSTEIGDYDVIWEYDRIRGLWFVGQIKKTLSVAP